MKALLILVSVFACALGESAQDRSIFSSSVTTKKIVEGYGYPFEEHKVQTPDGYILGLHRIPYSPKHEQDPKADRPVIFLQHGLLCSSSDWVITGPDSALGFILSDLGYDVWMGNARGNTYSKDHATKTPLLPPFWSFEWHEIALYDIPTMVDYILWLTGEDQLDYIGHSQGTTVFFVLNSEFPEFSEKIRSSHMLAPVAYWNNAESPIVKLAAPLVGQPSILENLIGNAEFLPSTKAMELLGSLACKETCSLSVICDNVWFLVGGFNEENLNKTLVPELMATTPAGASVNQIFHYLQVRNSGSFRQWDYGLLVNPIKYKKRSPPKYLAKNIEAEVHFYYSDNDYLAAAVDVEKFISEMNQDKVAGALHVEDSKFTHLDFLYGLNAKDQVYKHLLRNLGH